MQARQAVFAALKACCPAVDQQLSSTHLQQASSSIGEGAAAPLRAALGQPGTAAAEARATSITLQVWQEQLGTLCPQLHFVVQVAGRFWVLPGQAPDLTTGAASNADVASSSSIGGSSGSSSAAKCSPASVPLAAVEREMGLALASVSTNPLCFHCPATGRRAGDSSWHSLPVQRCAACRMACYCGPECARADWRRHGPICRALRQRPLAAAAEGLKAQQ